MFNDAWIICIHKYRAKCTGTHITGNMFGNIEILQKVTTAGIGVGNEQQQTHGTVRRLQERELKLT